MEYGLIGSKLGHSYSAIIHRKMGAKYDLVELDNDGVTRLLTDRNFLGINVTIPYKEFVMEHLDELDERAARIGAVNTIVNRGGKLSGYNTDYDGMRCILEGSGVNIRGSIAAVLGSGGTSKTAQCLLNDMGASEVIVVSRSGDYNYDYLASRTDINVIINTTPYGMSPNITAASLVDISMHKELRLVADAVYNPLMTSIVYDAKLLGIPAFGGMDMLVAQAISAAKLFGYGGYSTIRTIANEIIKSEQNIVLVGMPSSGKSYVAAKVAEVLGRECIDCDTAFEANYGISPASAINASGEPVFRNMESALLREICCGRSKVISTGGGAILSAANRYYIKANSIVVHVDRDISKLAVGGNRPLSTDRDALTNMYNTRSPLYKAIADYTIDNNMDYGNQSITEFVRWYNEYFSN